ncbi:T9SS type A sorting domain-containing protein [bacterium]|nr:T9SS type A sorting domain-containing protein [bacterium]
MVRKQPIITAILAVFFVPDLLPAQTIPVTFRYTPASSNVIRAFVPGTFNNWGPNSGGVIAADAPSRMDWSEPLGCYIKVVPLPAGTRQQYKFHEHPGDQWITDPLNPDINTGDNNNSLLDVMNGMLFQMTPAEGQVITGSDSDIMAAVCLAEGDSVIPDESVILFDGHHTATLENCWVDSLRLIRLPLPAVPDGPHMLKIRIMTHLGLDFADSVTFSSKLDHVFFYTPDHDNVLAGEKTLRWRVNLRNADLDSMILRHIGVSDTVLDPVTEKDCRMDVTLNTGQNRFIVRVVESDGQAHMSDTLILVFPEPQVPEPEIGMSFSDGSILLTVNPHDPQNQTVSCEWHNAPVNAAPLAGVDGKTGTELVVPVPAQPGDYAVCVTVTDTDFNARHTQTFFTVLEDGSVVLPAPNTVPQWVYDARIYCVFLRGFTEEGTIRSAADRLSYIRDMGFSVIWVLPVMDVEGSIDQNVNIGYNIVDFYNVEPAYGTNDDFRDFVSAAHELGLRVILDVTPNHSSRSHPFAMDARAQGPFSRYWDFYQHEIIPHNTNNMGQTVSSEGIVYYTGFSSALLNWNWSDAEARKYMIDVYSHWLHEYDVDGFRFDVYWGPTRRYGRDQFDRPLRQALRAVKADILLLGETDGTGVGTELQYADRAGGVDMAYDWELKNVILQFPSVAALDEKLVNRGYRPGENSYFLRFMENQDEWRSVSSARYNDIGKSLPVSAALFLSTGIPMLYQGQETGMGFNMSGSKEHLARATVDWNNAPAEILMPHYQKLAQIRTQFPQFRRQFMDTDHDGYINDSDRSVQPRLKTSSVSVYAYGRPWPDENGVVVMNFSNQPKDAEVILDSESWMDLAGIPYVDVDHMHSSDIYSGTTVPVPTDIETLKVSLEPYGVAVYILSLDEKSLSLPALPVYAEKPEGSLARFGLHPNFPNPFNPYTTLVYETSRTAAVTLSVYNLRGQRIGSLNPGIITAGIHHIRWNAQDSSGRNLPSGVYVVQLQAENQMICRKITIMR